MENSQEFNDHLNTLQTLLEYGNEPELETLKGLSHRSYKTKGKNLLMYLSKSKICNYKRSLYIHKTFRQ